jgi:hypothetical protein
MQLRHIELGDDPGAWRDLGFSVDRDGHLVLSRTVLTLSGRGGGFRGWWIDGVDRALDGLACSRPAWADEPAREPVARAHPNGVVAIDHVVVRTGDTGRTVGAFEEAGLVLRRTRSTTTHGAPVRQCFLWAGDVILEVVGPADGAPGPTDRAGLFGLAFVSDDLDRTAADLGPLLGPARDAVQPGRRIAGLRGDEQEVSLALAVMSPHPG